MKSCEQILEEIQECIKTKQISDDPTIQKTFEYSGVQWNDQGDINSCLRDSQMNFVEFSVKQGPQKIYRGLCLPQQCNAEYLNDNKNIVIQFTKGLKLPYPIQANQISFTPYPYNNQPSFSSSDFILVTLFLSLFIILIFASYAASKFMKNKKIQDNLVKQTNNRVSRKQFQENVIFRSSLEKPFLEQNKQQKDTENQKEVKKVDLKELRNSQQNVKKQSKIFQILNCWNLKENIQKIFTLNVSNKDLQAFNCIRVISFMQVILGHEFFIRVQYLGNPLDLFIIQKNAFSLFIFSCLFSVDVFFFLGGFFVAYVSADPKFLQLFSFTKKLRMLISFIAAIVNRLFRIMPSYLVALIIFWKYIQFFGDSPTWFEFINFSKQCNDGWWVRVLLIDNLFDDGQKCFGWGWYLSNDIQMFIFSLLLIIIYANHRLAGKISILVTFLTFQAISLYQSYSNNYLIISSLQTMPKQEYYFKPWSRSPPYFIGLIFGIFYKEFVLEKSKQIKTTFISQIQTLIQKYKITKYGCYSLGLFLIFFLIFGPRPLQVNGQNYWNQGFQNFWFGTCRTIYVVGIILVLLPGMCGSQDFLMKVMSSKIFQFIAKLTFQGYLIHYIVLTFSLWNFKDSLYVNNENILQLYSTELVFTLSLSLLFVILIEQPFTNLANIIFNRQKASKQQIAAEIRNSNQIEYRKSKEYQLRISKQISSRSSKQNENRNSKQRKSNINKQLNTRNSNQNNSRNSNQNISRNGKSVEFRKSNQTESRFSKSSQFRISNESNQIQDQQIILSQENQQVASDNQQFVMNIENLQQQEQGQQEIKQ
ncbi:acyltransferase family protein (macronuclear) [Tetrahymena thermophila SB210]|uniref:Acyltransferase family protein n=1 Tax=Tetrahymena thermophila (strain SB210) TaxID=312017 RepID=I7MB32_TETTS|nr:acyltransferase family protein [Tetrahymena thermophila SB210]EAS07221.1 acyltransferase family protein [Tetrahymena thermophila SB210]|eukprot:XP_001027463.1 acyltransferase family protein [Tetrahymena thermophila SB210]